MAHRRRHHGPYLARDSPRRRTSRHTVHIPVKNDDETFTSIKNSFQIKDESIKQESFLDSKTNRIILTAVILGLIGVIISLIIPKKHN